MKVDFYFCMPSLLLFRISVSFSRRTHTICSIYMIILLALLAKPDAKNMAGNQTVDKQGKEPECALMTPHLQRFGLDETMPVT